MPTYQYACTDCGDRSEVVQRFTDDPLTVCSACGGKLRKVFSPVGIVFKGSGFYRTDSRNGSSTVPAGKDAGNDKDKDSSASSSNGSGSSSSESSSGSSDKSSSGSGGDKSGSGSSGSTSSGSTSSSSGSKSATPVS
ncbi:MAG TPA: FmdB family zinc ribbon protein [Streptosporangiaceae bacterium]|nr:FmdB family zinc ribbon protein [Streptosporangiaceae bacterium]